MKFVELKSFQGQQEDAEEFLSFILNGMHEEMVKVIKNYEKKNHLNGIYLFIRNICILFT